MRITKLAAVALMLAGAGACGPSQHGDCDKDSSLLCGPTLIVGALNDVPGFSVGDVHLAGFDMQVMEAIGTGLGLKTSTHLLTVADREPELENGQVNVVIGAYSITRQRNMDGIDFAGPYMVSPQALLVRADDKRFKDTEAGTESVEGRSICTVGLSTAGYVDIPGANMDSHSDTTKGCVDMLDRKQVDAVFNDTLVLEGYAGAKSGKYQVVQSGTWGETQYYGIGMLKGHHDDCEKINSVLTGYLSKQWRTDFLAMLPKAAEKVSGSNTSQGDFESLYKPKASDITRLSCKL